MSAWTVFFALSTLLVVSHGGKDKPISNQYLKGSYDVTWDFPRNNNNGNSEREMEFGDEIKEIIQHLHNICAEKTGAAEEDILNCENGIFKEDQKLKCYMFCILEESSVADEDGIVDYEMLIGLIPEEWSERVHKMIFGCKHLDTPDKDKCQRAFDVHKCTYQADPDLYFLF